MHTYSIYSICIIMHHMLKCIYNYAPYIEEPSVFDMQFCSVTCEHHPISLYVSIRYCVASHPLINQQWAWTSF